MHSKTYTFEFKNKIDKGSEHHLYAKIKQSMCLLLNLFKGCQWIVIIACKL